MASSMHDHYLQHLDHEEDDFSIDEGNKKIRKPYTITKSRESWTDQEHDKFLEALHLFDRDWKKIEAFVGSKTVIQIRSHAQKYFLKVQKNRTGEHVPPPRPKRKSAQPYPQKAAKYGETDYVIGQQHYDIFRTNYSSMHPTPWIHHAPSSGTTLYSRKDGPDFVEVYKFIGEVFDPEITGHFEKLMSMSAVDRETIMVLMRNLTINLGNPDHVEVIKAFITHYYFLVGAVWEDIYISLSQIDASFDLIINMKFQAYLRLLTPLKFMCWLETMRVEEEHPYHSHGSAVELAAGPFVASLAPELPLNLP